MEAFFADVATVKSILGDVRKKLAKLNRLNDESKTATRTETMKRYRDEMNGVIEEVSTTARECKLRLENLDRANAEAAKGAGAGPGSSQERTQDDDHVVAEDETQAADGGVPGSSRAAAVGV